MVAAAAGRPDPARKDLPPARRGRQPSGFLGRLLPRAAAAAVLAGQLQALGFPADPHTMRLLHELLQDALAGHPDPVFFILDDVHLLQSVDLPGIVSFLAERLPAQVHIVLLSRNQIFSAAAQLRLGSGLLTIGAADLRLRRRDLPGMPPAAVFR